VLQKSEVDEILALSKQHPVVKRLYDAFRMYDESPYVDVYTTCYSMISSWQNELDENKGEFRIKDTEDKKFDRAFNVVKGMGDLIEKLDGIRQKMTPDQKMEADKKRRTKKLEDKIVLS
jgi:hypothetical protein